MIEISLIPSRIQIHKFRRITTVLTLLQLLGIRSLNCQHCTLNSCGLALSVEPDELLRVVAYFLDRYSCDYAPRSPYIGPPHCFSQSGHGLPFPHEYHMIMQPRLQDLTHHKCGDEPEYQQVAQLWMNIAIDDHGPAPYRTQIDHAPV